MLIRIVAASVLALSLAAAQPRPEPEWQTAAGGKRAFEVASVKLDPGPFRPPNFPLDPGDAFRPVGGRFSADFPISTYITFAYKLALSSTERQALFAQLPEWVTIDRYAIEARAEGNPTKDQMRLMMQSLLAERFRFQAHFETRVFSAFALVLVKPGKTGPGLRPYSEGVACDVTPAPGVFPPVCDVVALTMNANRIARGGSRNTTIPLLAGALPGMGGLDRPLVDHTGLTGRFDFTLEFEPEPARSGDPVAEAVRESQGPNFITAVREQLGLKLEPIKASLPFLVVDRVERPSGN